MWVIWIIVGIIIGWIFGKVSPSLKLESTGLYLYIRDGAGRSRSLITDKIKG